MIELGETEKLFSMPQDKRTENYITGGLDNARFRFDEQLDLLNKELITMGALCENAIAMSAKALTKEKPALAEKVSELSSQIDHKERESETMCLKLLCSSSLWQRI